jgi:hypothetical protein
MTNTPMETFFQAWVGVFIAGTVALITYRHLSGNETEGESSAETKEAQEYGCTSCGKNADEDKTFESEYSLEYINPEPVAGSSDVHGAEGFLRNSPSTAHGRGFASDTIATAQMASVTEGASPSLAPGQRFVPNATIQEGTDCVIGHAYNDLCPQCAGPGGKGVSIPVRVPQPINPNDYQTLSGLIHERPISPNSPASSGSGGYVGDEMSLAGMPWDNANDWMPEYRFPWPWSPAYSPTDPSRGFDHRSIRTY